MKCFGCFIAGAAFCAFVILMILMVSNNAYSADVPKPAAPHIDWQGPHIDWPGLKTYDGSTAPQSIVIATRDQDRNLTLTFTGNTGKPIVEIHPDGRVALHGTPNAAARSFWHAVSLMFPERCKV